MNIGELNRRITLQYPVQTADGMGGETVTWADYVTIWAAIWPVSARERVESGQVTGTITHKIRIRYRSGIKTSWRIKFGTRYFNIEGPPINANERNRMIDLLCTEAQ